MIKRSILIEIVCSLLILLFLYTGISKWLDFDLFIKDMNNQPFPNWITPVLVWTIPPLEVLIAIGLMFGKTRLSALYASVVLMLAFTIYAAAVLLHAFKYVPCSCGGIIRKLTWSQHIYFNVFFLGISLLGVILWKKELKKGEDNINVNFSTV